jgi:hypothetical protein
MTPCLNSKSCANVSILVEQRHGTHRKNQSPFCFGKNAAMARFFLGGAGAYSVTGRQKQRPASVSMVSKPSPHSPSVHWARQSDEPQKPSTQSMTPG